MLRLMGTVTEHTGPHQLRRPHPGQERIIVLYFSLGNLERENVLWTAAIAAPDMWQGDRG
jgi:hypothetical protein